MVVAISDNSYITTFLLGDRARDENVLRDMFVSMASVLSVLNVIQKINVIDKTSKVVQDPWVYGLVDIKICDIFIVIGMYLLVVIAGIKGIYGVVHLYLYVLGEKNVGEITGDVKTLGVVVSDFQDIEKLAY